MSWPAKGGSVSRMVTDHRVLANDPFRLTENSAQREISGHLRGERTVGMAEVGELLIAA
jgi:acyl-CoA dehydrogenase